MSIDIPTEVPLPEPDATNPDHLRFCADILDPMDGAVDSIYLRARADRLDAARTAEREREQRIEQAARAVFGTVHFDDELTERLHQWLAASRAIEGTAAVKRRMISVDLVQDALAQLDELRTPPVEVREVWEQELYRHQPVLRLTDGSIAGCQCLDRVFHRSTENWGTHLADVMQQLVALEANRDV